MTREALENAIREIVQPRLAITTIWEKGTTPTGATVPRPSTPYVTLNIVSEVSEGLPDGLGEAVLSGGDYLEQLVEDRYTRVSVKAYGSSSWDKLSDLRLYLQTGAARELADAREIGLAGIGEVTDLSGLASGSSWERVASMDLVIHRRDMLESDEGVLESLNIQVTHQYAGSTVATDLITSEV